MSNDNFANPCLKNVLNVFNGIDRKNGNRTYYDAQHIKDYSAISHFKGVGAYGGKLIFTHTNVATSGNQGIYLIGDEIDNDIDENYEIDHTPAWGHPGGAQVCGKYMAMALQKAVHDNETSEIQIYDVSDTANNQPMQLINTIPKDNPINGVGMTKENGDDGRYIVMAGDDKNLSFFRSKSSSLTSDTEFTLLETSCMDPLHYGGAGFALVTQEDGELFFLTMHASDGEESTMNLYHLTIDDDKYAKVNHIGKELVMKMPDISSPVRNVSSTCDSLGSASHWICEKTKITEPVLNSSFRWGKGLKVTSSTDIEIYATDRNVLPNPTSPGKNLGVVTWKGSSDKEYNDSDLYDVDWGSSEPYSSGVNLAVALGIHGHCVNMKLYDGGDTLYYRVGEADFDQKTITWHSSQPYHSASDFSIALSSRGYCIEVHRGSSGNNLYYTIGILGIEESFNDDIKHDIDLAKKKIFGTPDATIDWGDSVPYDTGANLAIALDNHGNCIEVHRGSDDGSNQDKLFYHVGKAKSSTREITWATDNSQKYDDSDPNLQEAMTGTGNFIDIAMDNEHNCIEVHRGSYLDKDTNTTSLNGLFYRVGKVDFDSGKISWGNSHRNTTCTTLSIDMDDRGNCVEMHRSASKEELYYRVGRIDVCSQTIDWGNDGSQNLESGINVSVAVDSKGNVIEVHAKSDDDNTGKNLYDRVGVLK